MKCLAVLIKKNSGLIAAGRNDFLYESLYHKSKAIITSVIIIAERSSFYMRFQS